LLIVWRCGRKGSAGRTFLIPGRADARHRRALDGRLVSTARGAGESVAKLSCGHAAAKSANSSTCGF